MPGPIPMPGLSPFQRLRSSHDRERMSFTLGTSSPLEQVKGQCATLIPVTVAQQKSRQESRRIVRDAMALSTAAEIASQSSFAAGNAANSILPNSSHPAENSVNSTVSLSRPSTIKSNQQEIVPPIGERFKVPPKCENCQEDRISDGDVLCWETGEKGACWKYVARQQSRNKSRHVFEVVDMKRQQNPMADLLAFLRSCIVPEGYPDSVSPAYTPYMQWRALKYFFGGAMSVFTTRSLLHAAGVTHGGAASTAVAVNWVIKDGAGRIGKMLSARHGKKFDCDMKQLRFTGDLLMELGAGVELATVAAPHLFLPLACAANIAKNVAAVTSTSTRAPIYKAFARGENIGDVTAKGECISNIADLLGTGLGIFISKRNPSLYGTFLVLSCGYLFSSYQEIKSVLLPSLNKARFGVAVQSFLDTGQVPSLSEGNKRECIFVPPWRKDRDLVLGARVKDAFSNLQKFSDILPLFQKENYLVTYNSSKRRIYAILKEKASSEDVLRAAFHAELLLHILQRPLGEMIPASGKGFGVLEKSFSSDFSVEAAVSESCKHISSLYGRFRHEALSKGWIMAESLLNPGNTRLCSWKEG